MAKITIEAANLLELDSIIKKLGSKIVSLRAEIDYLGSQPAELHITATSQGPVEIKNSAESEPQSLKARNAETQKNGRILRS